MKEHNEFDELARRKLAEREFQFEEKHWSEMEKMLGSAGKRDRLAWWMLPVLLLMIGGGVYVLRTEGTDNNIAQVQQAPINEIEKPTEHAQIENVHSGSDSAPAPINEKQTSDATLEVNSQNALPHEAVASGSTDRRTAARNTEQTIKSSNASRSSIERSENGSQLAANAALISDQENIAPIVERTDVDQIERSRPNEISLSGGSEVIAAATDRPVLVAQYETPIDHPSNVEPEPVAATGSTNTSDHGPDQDMGSLIPSDESSPEPPTFTETTDENSMINIDPSIPFINDGSSENNAEVPATIPSEALPIADVPNTDIVVTPTDTLASSGIVQDSIISPETPAAPTPIVDPRSPFEISFLAGMSITNSRYGGPGSENGFRSIEQQRTYGGGVELMRMGRNIGVGGGLHYSTYSELINTDEESRTESSEMQYYFLTPVDTTLLIITDTIQINGQDHYV
ncbi:MAG: hypothetical protein M3R08_06955, partial [Bacteroidota bacterium]|nr:hypothetical protein [Bacteroidota bacterium]